MNVKRFLEIMGADFYTGVPDSQLRSLCDYLCETYGSDPSHHVIGANEGSCAAIAAGYHLATGKVPMVYMQNSGEGNIINPAASLLHKKVYAIPVIFVIGWRGEPGVHDEPQHIYQGEITKKLLDDMCISSFIVGKDTSEEELIEFKRNVSDKLSDGESIALIIRKDALTYDKKAVYSNEYTLTREDAIRKITEISENDPIISTTGKASRELFEIRAANGQSHKFDFLTVGSMGHCSSIALGVALNKPDVKVWCIDGDGAALMHMGAMPVIAKANPSNLIHIVINNGAHETVGGMPTASNSFSLAHVALSCGYTYSARVSSIGELEKELEKVRNMKSLCFIEIMCAIGSRKDLGRPSAPPAANKRDFMANLSLPAE